MVNLSMKAALFCAMLMVTSFALEASGPFQYEKDIADTTFVHAVAEGIPAARLQEAEYDISKFTISTNLTNPEGAFRRILERAGVKNLSLSSNDHIFSIYRNSETLQKFIFDFQKAEAEEVFYFDLNNKIATMEKDPSAQALYETHRLSNNALCRDLLNALDANLDDLKIALMGSPSAKAKDKSGNEIYRFEKNLRTLPGLQTNILDQTKALKEKYGIISG